MSLTDPQYFVCDICLEKMYEAGQTMDKSSDEDYLHIVGYDLHATCLRSLIKQAKERPMSAPKTGGSGELTDFQLKNLAALTPAEFAQLFYESSFEAGKIGLELPLEERARLLDTYLKANYIPRSEVEEAIEQCEFEANEGYALIDKVIFIEKLGLDTLGEEKHE